MIELEEIITQSLNESQDLDGKIKDRSFQLLEREVFLHVKQQGAKILSAILNKLALIDHQHRKDKIKGEFQGFRKRKIKTIFGEVVFERAYYWSKEGGGFAPFDEKLGLDGGNLSPWVKEAITLLAAEMPFARAQKVFEKITQEKVSHETIQEVSQKRGEEIEREEKEKAQEAWEVFEGPSCADVQYGRVEETKRRDGWKKYLNQRVKDPPKRLFIQVDGGRLLTREEGWKEPKVALFFTDEDLAEVNKDRKELIRKEYVATLEGIEGFQKVVWLGGLRWGALSAEEVILIGDGSSWIWERIGSLFPGCIQILDWVKCTHFSGHIFGRSYWGVTHYPGNQKEI